MTQESKSEASAERWMKRDYPYEISPIDLYVLLRDGVEVCRESHQAVWNYLHHNHSYSVSHALKYEGYQIVPKMGW